MTPDDAPAHDPHHDSHRPFRHTGQRSGNRLFSEMEARVFQLMREGLLGAKIAEELGLDARSVRSAIARLRTKLGCETTEELAAMARRTATVQVAPPPTPVLSGVMPAARVLPPALPAEVAVAPARR